MRRLPPRPDLPVATLKRLKAETEAISAAADPKKEAERRYKNARETKWFSPVVNALKTVSGVGERCMFCSGSESSQVEHFKPKAVFTAEAMKWENFLWVCGICNQAKGDSFPQEADAQIIDPFKENVWDFFFLDEFGNLTPKWRTDLNSLDPRAQSTLEILALARDVLQQTRQQRINDLKGRIEDSLCLYRSGELTQEQLAERCRTWCAQAFQPDVADYFLTGPGMLDNPFNEFLIAAGLFAN